MIVAGITVGAAVYILTLCLLLGQHCGTAHPSWQTSVLAKGRCKLMSTPRPDARISNALSTMLSNDGASVLPQDQRYAFVCGLHRSGTTLITRCLMQHPMVSGFKNTGVIEDEGQFLQTVLPREIIYGGVGRFGFDPRAHMTEESEFNTVENSVKLLSEWRPHWDVSRPVLIEKTPSNLLRMRLLDRLVQPSSFIVVTRHPLVVTLASLKWTEGNLFSLLSHWVHCYRLARSDAALLDRVVWVSYEAFVADPAGQLARLEQFLGLDTYSDWAPSTRNVNDKYFSLWREQYCGDFDRSIEQPPPERKRSIVTRIREHLEHDALERARPLYRRKKNLRNFYDALDAVALFDPAVAEFGYSLTDLDRKPDV
jgi:hypothetical protein